MSIFYPPPFKFQGLHLITDIYYIIKKKSCSYFEKKNKATDLNNNHRDSNE